MILNQQIRREIKKISGGRINGGSSDQPAGFFLYILYLLIHHTRFCSNIFKSTEEALNLRYTLIKREFVKKMINKLVLRGKFFEKNNMVSNDSKFPNSARIAKKKRYRAVFLM